MEQLCQSQIRKTKMIGEGGKKRIRHRQTLRKPQETLSRAVLVHKVNGLFPLPGGMATSKKFRMKEGHHQGEGLVPSGVATRSMRKQRIQNMHLV